MVARSDTEALQSCSQCQKRLGLPEGPEALFVEDHRIHLFCSEACIVAFFKPAMSALKNEVERSRTSDDLSVAEQTALAGARWATLEKPDEIYVETLESGEERSILVRQFDDTAGSAYWCVGVTFFLQGDPSFLFHAWVTRDEQALVNPFRTRGKGGPITMATDQLAQDWTQNESVLAQLVQPRIKGDIPFSDFTQYEACIEETLRAPDEVWTEAFAGMVIYSFLKSFVNADTQENFSYVVLTRETEEEDQLEILDTFPTRDDGYLTTFRRGNQEYNAQQEAEAPEVAGGKRMLH